MRLYKCEMFGREMGIYITLHSAIIDYNEIDMSVCFLKHLLF